MRGLAQHCKHIWDLLHQDSRDPPEGSIRVKSFNLQAAIKVTDGATLAYASELKPLMKLADTLHSNSKGILNWWHSKITNGLIEGMNSLIQAAIAKARGYRNPKNLITIAYLIAGKLDFNTVPRLDGLPT